MPTRGHFEVGAGSMDFARSFYKSFFLPLTHRVTLPDFQALGAESRPGGQPGQASPCQATQKARTASAQWPLGSGLLDSLWGRAVGMDMVLPNAILPPPPAFVSGENLDTDKVITPITSSSSFSCHSPAPFLCPHPGQSSGEQSLAEFLISQGTSPL